MIECCRAKFSQGYDLGALDLAWTTQKNFQTQARPSLVRGVLATAGWAGATWLQQHSHFFGGHPVVLGCCDGQHCRPWLEKMRQGDVWPTEGTFCGLIETERLPGWRIYMRPPCQNACLSCCQQKKNSSSLASAAVQGGNSNKTFPKAQCFT